MTETQRSTETQRFTDARTCAAALIERLSGRVRLALPLGLGKPAMLANALYRQARADPAIELHIFTALTLERPAPGSDLERRLLGPMIERLYGQVPQLDYAVDLRGGELPGNVTVEEFYLRPGAWLGVPQVQQSYASSNYTHAPRDLLARGINVIAQMVAPSVTDPSQYSLSCNPDVTLDLMAMARRGGGRAPLLVGESNPALPFMPGQAELAAGEFDFLLEGPEIRYDLFPVPNRPVSLAEQIIGLRTAALVKDGGTIQVGIGSLGDAIAHAVAMRRNDNAGYRGLLSALGISNSDAELDDLPQGLYGASEMFGEGLLHLREQGVLRRTVANGIYLHAGFYLGSAAFYESLRQLSEADRRGIDMTPISFTNNLLGDEATKREQRRDARFVNTAMMVTLVGAAVSDALENGQVVSGVGGQYNFVAMAHELEGARSVIMLPATRTSNGRVSSNIVWNYGHTTIPRHLRDMVVTEYGTADLRGASDADVIARLLNLADSRFQEDLREQSVAAGKLPEDYRIPQRYRNNHPRALNAALAGDSTLLESLPLFPLGTDLTGVEAQLAVAMSWLGEQRKNRRALLGAAWRGFRQRRDPRLEPAMTRMGLAEAGPAHWLQRVLLAAALLREVHDNPRPLLAADEPAP